VTRLCPLALAAALLLALAGCSPATAPSREAVVFSLATGYTQLVRATTADVVDIGVPELDNISDHGVGLRDVRLVSHSPAVRVRSITAYVYGPEGGIGLGHGDLRKYCRKIDKPYLVNSVTIAPRAVSRWYLVIAMTFTRAGRYQLSRVRIDYVASERADWQSQNLNTTVVIRQARPGTKPAFDGC